MYEFINKLAIYQVCKLRVRVVGGGHLIRVQYTFETARVVAQPVVIFYARKVFSLRSKNK